MSDLVEVARRYARQLMLWADDPRADATILGSIVGDLYEEILEDTAERARHRYAYTYADDPDGPLHAMTLYPDLPASVAGRLYWGQVRDLELPDPPEGNR